MSFPVLNTYQIAFPCCSDQLKIFQTLYNKKLWNQLTLVVLKFIYQPQVKGKITFEFYTEFIKKFQKSIDQINLLKIIKQSIVSLPTQQVVEFLENFQQKQAFTQQTKAIVQSLRGFVYVQTDIGKCLILISKVSKFLENRKDVDSFVYSTFYRFGMKYYQAKNHPKLFYTNALQFMAYTPTQELEQKEKLDMLVQMALSVIISDQIYNFSELLEQPLLISLKESPFNWIYQLLQVFNKGDIAKYFQLQQQVFSKNSQLAKNQSKIITKIQLMALLDLAFNLPKNDRVVKFVEIAKKCNIKNNGVELLIIKAMALHLVRGRIDQFQESVTITWVVPKVLEKDGIGVIMNKFQEWSKGVSEIKKIVQTSRLK